MSGMSAGKAVVYYRERGTSSAPSAPGDKENLLDFGHAFIGIYDNRSGKTYFLDGWPGKGNEFTFNRAESQDRLEKHDNISWDINEEQVDKAIDDINGILNSSSFYDFKDFNCTDAAGRILGDIGLPVSTSKDIISSPGGAS
jgi:hypothetical protein